MTNYYFITGTDTDCGKTHVTCQLLDSFHRRGETAIAIKPVATGCFEENGKLISEDVQRIQHHQPPVVHDLCPWRFKPPISPHLAAKDAGQTLSLQALIDFCYQDKWAPYDHVLIEGAGGLMVPLNDEATWLDFLSLSHLPVILVVGMQLGCLNHALLSAEALETRQINCVGWVANCIDPNMLMIAENIDSLSQRIKWPLLATFPHVS